MKWLLIIAAVLVVLVMLVALVGLMLPRAHHATRMVRFRQPPEVVFAAITGPQDWRGVTKVELSSSGGARKWHEQAGRHTITFEELTSEPPRLYRSRIADKNLPFAGTWTYELAATGEGCTCRITEDGEVYNPIFRFISKFVIGHTKTMDDYLSAMGRKFNQVVDIE